MRCVMIDEEIYDMAELFKMFSDPTRIKILLSLFENELNVTEIVEKIGATQTAVSHQLRALKQNHLVKCRRDGKKMIYSLADDHVETIINMAIEHIEE
ncbi:MAG: winged helix-turn-helix transcriptional regulator [Ruminococcaceae bacterium]|nr:winged helix-turn-helix transcriptional regulator [Oscillospiraceae bacterium]